MVQLLDLLPHPRQGRGRLRATLQQDDAFHHIVAVVYPHLAQTDAIAVRHLCDILDKDRCAALLRDDDVLDVA